MRSVAVRADLGRRRYTQQVVAVRADLAVLPGVGRAEVVLPRGVPVDAGPGDDAVLALDGGDGEAVVLTGEVVTQRTDAWGTTVVLADGGAALGRTRSLATFRGQRAAGAIRSLAGEAGVGCGTVDADLELTLYVAHQQRTTGEHVATLASWSGAVAALDADGDLAVRASVDRRPDAAVRWGRDLLAYEVSRSAPGNGVTVVGFGPAGTAGAPDALVPTSEALHPGSDAPDAERRWTPRAALRTPGTVEAAGDAATAAGASATHRLHASLWLHPHLRPGDVLEVQELPDGLDAGPWLITTVAHRAGGRAPDLTRIEAVAATAPDGGLLGALLGAL